MTAQNLELRQIILFHILENLAIVLLEQTLERLSQESNINAALWFAQQIAEVS